MRSSKDEKFAILECLVRFWWFGQRKKLFNSYRDIFYKVRVENQLFRNICYLRGHRKRTIYLVVSAYCERDRRQSTPVSLIHFTL